MNPREDGHVVDVFMLEEGVGFRGEFTDEFDIHFADEASGGGRFGEEVE
jgi:hypothetical protein